MTEPGSSADLSEIDDLPARLNRADHRLSTEWASALEGPAIRTLTAEAIHRLRQAIIMGDLAPGTRLRIEHLAAALGMSQAPIREALQQLSSSGLVDYVPRRGARVAELSLSDLVDTYLVRLRLEVTAIELAAMRFTDADREAGERVLAEYMSAYRREDAIAGRTAHTAFHFLLYEASGSTWLPRLIRPVWENAERYRLAQLPQRGRVEERRREHERILAACAARDVQQAAAELSAHLCRTANLVAAGLNAPEPFALDGTLLQLPRSGPG